MCNGSIRLAWSSLHVGIINLTIGLTQFSRQKLLFCFQYSLSIMAIFISCKRNSAEIIGSLWGSSWVLTRVLRMLEWKYSPWSMPSLGDCWIHSCHGILCAQHYNKWGENKKYIAFNGCQKNLSWSEVCLVNGYSIITTKRSSQAGITQWEVWGETQIHQHLPIRKAFFFTCC